MKKIINSEGIQEEVIDFQGDLQINDGSNYIDMDYYAKKENGIQCVQ